MSNLVQPHGGNGLNALLLPSTERAAELKRAEDLVQVPMTSREDTGFGINGRIPGAIGDGRLEARAGLPLSAEKSQVMICGNPAMVRDTQAVLESRGLRKNRRREPGHITTEQYWK